MDWELYERFRASVCLAAIVLASLLLLFFQRAPVVRQLRTLLVQTTLPIDRFLSDIRSSEKTVEIPSDTNPGSPIPAPTWSNDPEASRRLTVLETENKRLSELLELKQERWPRAVAAHVTGRDPMRWFQEIVIDKGKEEGVSADDPVVAIAGENEGLVGRVVDAGSHVSRVMLIQDSLSAVAASANTPQTEDGVLEGSNSHALLLRYLDRGSKVKIGDTVETSGLGGTFPAGIPIGSVVDLSLDPRQLFLEAHIRSVIAANQLHVVLVLTGRSRSQKGAS